MYLDYFALREHPFELSDDPKYYFAPPHEAAWITLEYALEQQQGLAMLTGPPGTGKTTLLRRMLEILYPNGRGYLLSDAGAVGGSLIKQFAAQLGIHAARERLPTVLGNFLEREAARNRRVVLVLDECQTFNVAQLEDIRFLSNRYASEASLLQIFLVGLPSLENKLSESGLESINQRIAVQATVEPLTAEQTASYIQFRLRVAGAEDTKLFTPDAVAMTHERSHGVPRLINLLSERALAVGYVDEATAIDASMVTAAADDLPPRLFETRAEAPAEEGGSGATAVVGAAVGAALTDRLDRIEHKLDQLCDALGHEPVAPIAIAVPSAKARSRSKPRGKKRSSA